MDLGGEGLDVDISGQLLDLAVGGMAVTPIATIMKGSGSRDVAT